MESPTTAETSASTTANASTWTRQQAEGDLRQSSRLKAGGDPGQGRLSGICSQKGIQQDWGCSSTTKAYAHLPDEHGH